MKFKICGIKNTSTIDCCEKNGVNFFGMIFYKKSPRFISLNESKKLVHYSLQKNIEPVGVFVDESIENIVKTIHYLKLKYIQLHGTENNEFIINLKKITEIKVLKSISVNSHDDIANTKKINDADFFLFDYLPLKNELPGGNAKQFDWEILKNLKISKPWFISGGINEENINKIKDFANPDGIDLSSGVEESPGIKNNNMIDSLFNKYYD